MKSEREIEARISSLKHQVRTIYRKKLTEDDLIRIGYLAGCYDTLNDAKSETKEIR